MINAFRHQRFLHPSSLPSVEIIPAVINAFRHQRFLHAFAVTSFFFRSSDQRLSASKIFAPDVSGVLRDVVR